MCSTWLVRGAAILVGLALLLLTSASVAQNDDEDAATLKKEGDQAMVERRYKDALANYDASYAKNPDPALLYNRGRAYESLGRFPEALAAFEAFVAQASAPLKARVPKLDELIDEVRGKVSYLTLTTNAQDARVLLDKELLGPAPIERLAVNAGEAIVEVVAEGFHPSSQPVTLPGREVVTLEVVLQAKDVRGTLVVRSDPTGAKVSVDGKAIGLSPAETRLEPGNHRVLLELDGYESHETQAVITPQGIKEIDASLDPIVTEQWWFWTSIGGAVVITAVAIGLGVGLSERDPDRGDIAPGTIKVPIISFD
jgi:hypothetical protein